MIHLFLIMLIALCNYRDRSQYNIITNEVIKRIGGFICNHEWRVDWIKWYYSTSRKVAILASEVWKQHWHSVEEMFIIKVGYQDKREIIWYFQFWIETNIERELDK